MWAAAATSKPSALAETGGGNIDSSGAESIQVDLLGRVGFAPAACASLGAPVSFGRMDLSLKARSSTAGIASAGGDAVAWDEDVAERDTFAGDDTFAAAGVASSPVRAETGGGFLMVRGLLGGDVAATAGCSFVPPGSFVPAVFVPLAFLPAVFCAEGFCAEGFRAGGFFGAGRFSVGGVVAAASWVVADFFADPAFA